jgi:hypothetical protein
MTSAPFALKSGAVHAATLVSLRSSYLKEWNRVVTSLFESASLLGTARCVVGRVEEHYDRLLSLETGKFNYLVIRRWESKVWS